MLLEGGVIGFAVFAAEGHDAFSEVGGAVG